MIRIMGTILLMLRCPLLVFYLLVFPFGVHAQDEARSTARDGARGAAEAYLVPQTIFVGDRGRLVVPLGQAFAGEEPFVREAPGELPKAGDLVINRIELEKRSGASRLLIDFVPFAPGILTLPDIVPSKRPLSRFELETLTVRGLKAEVASILVPGDSSLSNLAPPLHAPGTSLVIYGGAAVILLALFLGIGVSFWGRRHFSELLERFRRRRLLRAMKRFLIRMGAQAALKKDDEAAGLFALLSGEFREFLTLFTGVNCRVLTPAEFGSLEPGCFGRTASAFLKKEYLKKLFNNWELLRFSGSALGLDELFGVLKELKAFVTELEKLESLPSPALKPVLAGTTRQGSGKAGAI
ncbi:MAG: hypothetical protein LBF78_02470 [Treponema sp.]|jgi:hypothetical protein|nr:hypothetical protein [Treponema sp.]